VKTTLLHVKKKKEKKKNDFTAFNSNLSVQR